MAAVSEEEIRRQQIEDGRDPEAPASGFEAVVPPRLARQRLGMTQLQFATALGIPVAMLRNREQNRVRMDSAARALMRLVFRHPQTIAPARTSGPKSRQMGG